MYDRSFEICRNNRVIGRRKVSGLRSGFKLNFVKSNAFSNCCKKLQKPLKPACFGYASLCSLYFSSFSSSTKMAAIIEMTRAR